MIYILVIVFGGSYGFGSTTLQVEFNNQAQCEATRAHIIAQKKLPEPIYHGCYPKGYK